MSTSQVLFACVQNAGRSQMAAGLFNLLADPFRAGAISAGTDPAPAVHPEVIEVMREVGVDLQNEIPRLLTDDEVRFTTVLVTMGCGDVCPTVPGIEVHEWNLEDPHGKPAAEVRRIRDEIKKKVIALLKEHHWERPE